MGAEELGGSGGSSIELWLAGGDEPHPDVALQGRVWDELHQEAMLSSADLEVEVTDRVAVLEGTVDHDVARVVAERAARRVDGLHDVRNRIRVRVSSPFHGRFTHAEL